MGDHDVFVKMVKDHEGIIFKIASIYSQETETKQDLYQEIVLQLWKSYGSFRGEATPSTWMYRIGLNTAITFMRKAKRRGNNVSMDDMFEIPEQRDDESEEQILELYHSIRQLNALEKGIILLFLEDKSHEEIGIVTGLTKTNIGTRISRIKDKLRKQMKQ